MRQNIINILIVFSTFFLISINVGIAQPDVIDDLPPYNRSTS